MSCPITNINNIMELFSFKSSITIHDPCNSISTAETKVKFTIINLDFHERTKHLETNRHLVGTNMMEALANNFKR